MDDPFTYEEALALWSRLVVGWARHLDESGARTLIDGVPNAADAGGSYEGVTRMLWGLGGWLSQPGRPAILRWRGETFDAEALLRRALVVVRLALPLVLRLRLAVVRLLLALELRLAVPRLLAVRPAVLRLEVRLEVLLPRAVLRLLAVELPLLFLASTARCSCALFIDERPAMFIFFASL